MFIKIIYLATLLSNFCFDYLKCEQLIVQNPDFYIYFIKYLYFCICKFSLLSHIIYCLLKFKKLPFLNMIVFNSQIFAMPLGIMLIDYYFIYYNPPAHYFLQLDPTLFDKHLAYVKEHKTNLDILSKLNTRIYAEENSLWYKYSIIVMSLATINLLIYGYTNF